jgi:hypothetical protein
MANPHMLILILAASPRFGTGTRDLLSSLASTTSEPIHVFPNPASETIQLTGQDIQGVTQVRIFDIQGKLVQSSTEDFYSVGIDLSVSTLNPGLYTVQVEQNGTVYAGRFMKL